MVTPFTGFDGTNWPKLNVQAGLGGTITPEASVIVLNVGPGLGTGQLGGTNWTDITSDVQSIRTSRGRDSDIDSAAIGSCTIVVDNSSGYYDPTNLNGVYLSSNVLTTQQGSLEDGTTTGWEPGINCTITSSATVAYHGARSLRLSSSASGDMWAQTSPLKAGFPVVPLTAYTVTAFARAGTTVRQCRISVWWYDASETLISATDTTPTNNSATGWVKLTRTGLAPDNAVRAAVICRVNGTGAGAELHYFDLITMQPSGVEVGIPVRVRAQFNNVLYDRFYGELVDVELDIGNEPTATLTCADGLEKLGRAQLPVTSPSFDGDKTGARIGHIADAAAWPTSLRALDTGYATLGTTTFGANALPLIQQVEKTEFGLVFVDGAGKLTFYDRHQTTTAARSTTVQAELTDDNTVANGVDMVTLGVAKSRERAFNDVHITRDATTEDDQPVEQVATDSTSVGAYGLLSLTGGFGELLRNDFEALQMAQGLLLLYTRPRLRVRDVQVEAISLNLWAVLLPLTLLDRIKVRRNYGPNTITMELLVQGVTEEITSSPPRWDFTFATSNTQITTTLFVLGTSQIGVGRLGW
jgi:hypothetical protein